MPTPAGPSENQAPRQGVLRDQVEIGHACGHHKGFAQLACNHACRNAIGVIVMGVNQVKVETVTHQTADGGQGSHRQRRRGDSHPDPGWQKVTWMMHLDAIPLFDPRRRSKLSVIAKALALEWEPGHWCDHPAFHLATLKQLPQTRLDKDPVDRTNFARIQRGEQQGTNGAHGCDHQLAMAIG
jgi:hypothetical protein